MGRFTQPFNFDIALGSRCPRSIGQTSPRRQSELSDPIRLVHAPRRRYGPGASPARPLRSQNPLTTLLPLRSRL